MPEDQPKLARTPRGTAHIGTSGWSYDHWAVVFYPPGLPAARRLAHYASRLPRWSSNASFYHWPRESSFAGWRGRLPEGFILSVKAPRGLTHGRKLYGPEAWVERIVRGWHELGEPAGCAAGPVAAGPGAGRCAAGVLSLPRCPGGSG